ncbi:Zinc finger C2H2-type [Sesbania bispinosa]|nr:Zinc finger C2H2-type [Sesbania bispinosa]
MANNFLNSSQFYFLNYVQRLQHDNLNENFVCRLCNQVFTTYQSIITHLESHHIPRENLPIGILNNINAQRELIPSPLQPIFSRPALLPETRNFVNSRVFQAPPRQPMVMPRPRTNPSPYANLQVAASQPLFLPPQVMPSSGRIGTGVTDMAHKGRMEVSPIDGTKPYIDLLDKPIDNNMVDNLANINDDTLDLALRL